jgi:predicted amidophosphoribosyltransferase
VFCSHCGNAIPDDVNFCPKCGVRTVKGVEQNVPLPGQGNWEERFESTVETIGEELEKAFSTARRQLEQAYHRTKESMRKTSDTVNCPNCGETNQNDTNYCYRCGTKLNA